MSLLPFTFKLSLNCVHRKGRVLINIFRQISNYIQRGYPAFLIRGFEILETHYARRYIECSV